MYAQDYQIHCPTKNNENLIIYWYMGALDDNKVCAGLCWILFTSWHRPSFEQTMAAWIHIAAKTTYLYMLKTVLPLCMRYTYTSSTSSCFIMLKVKKYTPERGRYESTFVLTIEQWGLGDSKETYHRTSHLMCCYVVCRFFFVCLFVLLKV